jgi:hypothetical protein
VRCARNRPYVRPSEPGTEPSSPLMSTTVERLNHHGNPPLFCLAKNGCNSDQRSVPIPQTTGHPLRFPGWIWPSFSGKKFAAHRAQCGGRALPFFLYSSNSKLQDVSRLRSISSQTPGSGSRNLFPSDYAPRNGNKLVSNVMGAWHKLVMMRFSFSLWESVDLLPERVQDSHTRWGLGNWTFFRHESGDERLCR